MNDGRFFVFSRILLVLASAVSPLGMPLHATKACAEETFEPYDVYVDQDEVVARCGPGGDYYRTDPLRHGQRLEVYLETPDGWLGIRPPDNSFCWVPADSVTLDRSGNLGSVTEAGTLAWIGTHLGKARKYMWQVQLSEGEQVTVLGRAEREGPDGPQMWYRISPPAGEFRWLHRDQVVDNPELLLRDKPRPGEMLANGMPTPLEDDGIEPLEIPESASKKRSKGLMATAKSILLNGADEYSPSVATENRLANSGETGATPLSPMNDRGAIPIAANPVARTSNLGASDLSFAQSQSLAAQTAETANSQFAQPQYPQPQAMQVQYDLAAGRGAVGSGVADNEYANQQFANPPQPIARAIQPPQISIASQPMVRTIGAVGDETEADGAAQASGQAAGLTGSDANWVRGSGRAQRPNANPNTTATPPQSQQDGQPLQILMPPAHSQSPLPPQMLIPNQQPTTANSQQRVGQPAASQDGFQSAQSRFPAAIVSGNVDTLQLELSRRMVATAPAADVEPVRQAAQRISQTDASETERQRARLLVQRIEQYQSIARRRDGEQPASAVSSLQAAARSAGTVTIPPGQVMLSGGSPIGGPAIGGPAIGGSGAGGPGSVEAAGYLVQVYSARPDSPPFALTDATGKTTHYVSPMPGVNLRRYLNQHISIGGQSGYETGLDTPHIIATAAVRSPELR